MSMKERFETPPIRIRPGGSQVLFRADGSTVPHRYLCVVATQSESLEDGGSQTALATIEVGEGSPLKAQFDLREVATISVPSTLFSITVHNRNELHQPALDGWVYGSRERVSAFNTLTSDISYDMDQPNIRIPAFAVEFSYDLFGPGVDGYTALLSDSATGETYGLASPGVRYPLTRRVRFVRFMNVPQQVNGQVTFFLAI